MSPKLQSAHTVASDPIEAARELVAGISIAAPAVVTYFYGHERDSQTIARELTRAWPNADIIGCSTAGELSQRRLSSQGISLMAMSEAVVRTSASSLADCSNGIETGMAVAVASLEAQLGRRLADLDAGRFVGVVLIDSTHGTEEAVLAFLGNRAPLLSFVGGSAGDNLQFARTEVRLGETATTDGCALLLMELDAPWRVAKFCNFGPGDGAPLRVTAVSGRLLEELDGRPATEVLAERTGVPAEQISLERLFLTPLGQLIDGEAWVRHFTVPAYVGTALNLGCEVPLGAELHVMKARGDLLGNTAASIKAVRDEVGPIAGALVFDCVLRRQEVAASGGNPDEIPGLFGFPAAGFHTQGESWIAHMHHTLTALFIGES